MSEPSEKEQLLLSKLAKVEQSVETLEQKISARETIVKGNDLDQDQLYMSYIGQLSSLQKTRAAIESQLAALAQQTGTSCHPMTTSTHASPLNHFHFSLR